MPNRNETLQRSRECSNPALQLYRYFDGRTQDGIPQWSGLARNLNKSLTGEKLKALHGAIRARQDTLVAGLGVDWDAIQEPHVTQWRFAIGLSYGRLWEVGFQLHPINGLPYIPASAVKGAVRHCAVEEDSGKEHGAAIELLFGTPEKEGRAIFFDAYAVPKADLMSEDIINQHNREYYNGTGAAADDTDPVPVKLLTVTPGTTFHFVAVWPKRHAAEGELLRGWFHDCLGSYGFGAKTRKGYGLFL